MWSLFKRALGLEDPLEGSGASSPGPTASSSFSLALARSSDALGDEPASAHDTRDGGDGRTDLHDYFSTMAAMQEAVTKRDFVRATELARRNLAQIPGFVAGWRIEHGAFAVQSIPAIERGGTLFALAGDSASIDEMERMIAAHPQLGKWREVPSGHRADLTLVVTIESVIAQEPGVLQSAMKQKTGEADGRRLSTLIGWLEKAGRIRRVKQGSTYALYASSARPLETAVSRSVGSHRGGAPVQIRDVDVSTLPYLPLPRAPRRWEVDRFPERFTDATEAVEVRDTDAWRVLDVVKIPMEERPDPAFRDFHATADGIILIDDLGKTLAPAAAIAFDQRGVTRASRGLLHDLYRVGSNALGRGFIGMSKSGILHAYDADLTPIVETSLVTAPEVLALRNRLSIPSDALRNHLRTVSLAFDATRYLVTGVDEAWCISIDGTGLWGLRLPLQEGWSRIADTSQDYGTRAEIDNALQLMGLSWPVTPIELKRRYRELAKTWHPDLNPGDGDADRRMKSLNNAASMLTGLDASSLPVYTGASFVKVLGDEELDADGVRFTVSFGMKGDEVQAADWIYAAGFAGLTYGAYLAGYSGRIIRVDDTGTPLRAYDIGAVPRRIVDTGDYLYFLTDTRLYVLRDDSLQTIVDVLDAGDLIVAQTGFGLLENKRFRWFREDGAYVGAVVTKDPIRRVHWTPEGMIVETRQRRALVGGVETWWEVER